MTTEGDLNARIEQDQAFREEAERFGALDNPEALEVLEDIGFRLGTPADLEIPPGEIGLTAEQDIKFDKLINGGFNSTQAFEILGIPLPPTPSNN